MSDTLTFSSDLTSRMVITSDSGQRWNTSGTPALESHVDANWSDYLITPTQVGTSATWLYTIPAALPAGDYTVQIFDGASPLVTDLPIGEGAIAWDGSNLVTTYTVAPESKVALTSAYDAAKGEAGANATATGFATPEDLTAAGTSVSVVSPVDITAGDTLTLVRGDAYLDAIGTAIQMTIVDTRLPATVDSDGSTVALKIKALDGSGDLVEGAGTIESWTPATSTAVLKFDLPAAKTVLTPGVGRYRYDVEWLIEGDEANVVTSVADKAVTIVRDQRE